MKAEERIEGEGHAGRSVMYQERVLQVLKMQNYHFSRNEKEAISKKGERNGILYHG